MADVKISALPAATTPLAGTEVLPIVQSATTKQVSIANVTAGRAISASSLTLTTPLSVANGGTGLTSLTAGYIPYGNGTGAFSNSSGFVFDGTNLGIGTSSPSSYAPLSVRLSNPSNGILAFLGNSGASSQTGSCLWFNQNGVDNWTIGQPAGVSAFVFWNGAGQSNERMRLDSAGNLGLGVTPSAWPGQSASYYVAQIGKTALYDAGGGAGRMTFNAYVDSSGINKYISSSYATRYDQQSGEHRWMTAASGSAGSAISFTQAMTLDASGRLGIGTSGPSFKLDVQDSAAVIARAYCTDATSASYASFTAGTATGVTSVMYSYSGAGWFGMTSNHPMLFMTNNAERMRIDASGNLLVGTTSTGGKISLTNTPSTEWGVWFNTTVDIANGGNSAFANGSGMIIVTEAGVNGASAVYIMGGGQVTLVSTTSSTYWDSATTTPAAGKASIAYSGTAYTLYNNQGGLRTFYVAMLRTRNNV